jgi:hypothetical protein
MKYLNLMTSAVLLTGMITACGTEPEPVDTEPRVEDPMMTEHGPTLDLDASVAAARTKMAERLEISEDEIEVLEAQRVTWPNGALGCPEPDMMYTQALVGGYYIKLQAGSEVHAYHAGRDGHPFFCPQDRSEAPRATHHPTS